MKPTETLQRHVDLTEALCAHSSGMPEYGLRRLVLKTLEIWLHSMSPNTQSAVTTQFLDSLALQIKASHTYLVTSRMAEAVIATANTYLSGLETSSSEPPPQGCGVAFFETPLHLVDLRGRDQLVHMISWGNALIMNKGTKASQSLHIIMLWSDVRRGVDEVLAESPESIDVILRAASGFSPIQCFTLHKDQRVGSETVTSEPEDVKRLIEEEGFDPDQICHESPNVVRWVVALWRLLKDTVVVQRKVVPPPDRAVRRRAQRLKLAPTVEVVTLRHESRTVLAPGSGTPLRWRSPVPGHYHTYWTGPGRVVKERRWVSYHERGPKGAPYKPKKGTVNRLAR